MKCRTEITKKLKLRRETQFTFFYYVINIYARYLTLRKAVFPKNNNKNQ